MRVAFYFDYDKYQRDEAPGILPFIQVLRDRNHSVEFITSEKELLEKVVKEKYDVVAISVLSSLELREALKAAVRVKKSDPYIVVILGGHGTTHNAERLACASGIDAVVEGEGEFLLPMILEHVRRAEDSEGIVVPFKGEVELTKQQIEFFKKEILDLLLKDRVFYKSPITEEQASELFNATFERTIKKGNENIRIFVPISIVFNTTERRVVAGGIEKAYEKSKKVWEREHSNKFPLTFEEFARHSLPYPTGEELNELYKQYPWEDVKKRNWKGISIYAQRGCNWRRCSYCGITTLPGRKLGVQRIVEILKEAEKNGIKKVTFDDDNFVQDANWISQLCDEIVRHGLNRKLAFGAMMRVDAIKDLQLLQKLRNANFGRLQIGVESFVPKKVGYFNKTIPGREEEYIKKAEELIFNCLKLDIVPGIFIITTRPKEKQALLEIANELLAISKIIKKAYREYNFLPIFSFNDILMAYPAAPLLESEGYKKMLVPLGAVEDGGKIRLDVLEIPYAFKFKSMALANFIGNLTAISAGRSIPPEVLNETLEHIEDLTYALQISAEHLDSDIGIAFEFIRELNKFSENEVKQFVEAVNKSLPEGKKILPGDIAAQMERLLAHRILNPRDIQEAAKHNEKMLDLLTNKLPEQSSAEKKEVLQKCREIGSNLAEVESAIYAEVKKYLSEARAELENKMEDEEFFRKIKEIRNKTEEHIDRMRPYLNGRNSLEALVKWISEFESAKR